VLLAALAIGAPQALAATYNVAPGVADASGACAGIAPTFSCPTLREAVEAANEDKSPPTVIQLRPGAYPLTLGTLKLTREMTLAGSTGGASSVIERTGGEGPLIEVAEGAGVTFSSLRLTAHLGLGSEPPPWKGAVEGGLVVNRGTLNVTESDLSGSKPVAHASEVARGGAIYNTGQLAIRASSLSNDGAIAGTSAAEGSPEGGQAAGGAIYSAAGAVTITGSTLNGDIAVGGTGGARPEHAGKGGQAEGGAIMIAGGTLTLVNDTITGDSAHGGPGGEGVGTGLPGQPGPGYAGGIMKRGPEEAVIASTTIATNTATSPLSSAGGNVYLYSGTVRIKDTMIDSGVANTNPTCVVKPNVVSDAGHNLEDDTQGQCGFSSANGDIAAPALLLVPGDYGGPVHTIGLLPGSPALGTGGACTDPTAGETQLLTDARGFPRPAGECDIGAFQAQPVVPGMPPIAAGTPVVGQTLTCGTGTWGGDGPLSYSYGWLRNGAPIAGAAAGTYTLTSADAGQQIACSVTARGPRGQAHQTGIAVSIDPLPPPPRSWPAPVISRVSQSAGTWSLGSGLPHASRRLAVGTRFDFTLNEAAIVTFTFSRPASGRLVGHSCQAPSSHNSRRRRCTRLVSLGSFSFLGLSGVNHVSFHGRISSRARLGRGSFALTISARAHGHNAKPHSLRFTIAG